jgi:glycosyltransferase involved in cell wall biosynthesis
VRELAGLLAAGADVRILSLKPPSEKLVQPDAARMLPRVRHPAPAALAALLRARSLASHPLALSQVALKVTQALSEKPTQLAKTFEALARGVEHLGWIREFDPDVIHAHWGTFPSTVAWALGQVLRKPFGFTCHAHDIFVNDQLLKEKIESAAVPVTISQFNVRWLTERATPRAAERMKVVHCGVELPTLPFRAGDREPGSIMAVGRLDPIKGFDVLIDALGELAKQGRRVRCRIIGEGPLGPSMKEQIARHGIGDTVEMVGAIPQAEVRKLLYRSSIFALPSQVTETGDRDGIPVSLMEAMAAGTPVVSTLVSGIPELITDGKEGLLVPEKDPKALAAALARLLDDPSGSQRMADTARHKVEREFDASVEARKMLDLFVHASA